MKAKINLAGLNIDSLTKNEFLSSVLGRIESGKKTFVITPYSEFLYRSLRDTSLLNFLNQADFAVADGIGIFWAKKYLSLPGTAKSYWGKISQSYWQALYSLATIIFYPQWIKSALPEKIVGADLVWDFAKLASEKDLSLYLLGGFGDTPEQAKQKLISKYPNIKISASNKNPNDASIIEDINKSNADFLFVAYGPIVQEKWIVDNLSHLNVKLAIGVGGSFDYIAGVKTAPPKFIRYSGLEWLWRLVTQPTRVKRICQATFGLVDKLIHYKVFSSYPYRPNVVSIILNKENKILICQRNPDNSEDYKFGFFKKDALNYWQFPQGGRDKDETLEQTVVRECKEELDLNNISVLAISPKKHSYFFPNAIRPFCAKQSEYKGQEQSIAYIKFNGDDSEIKVDNIEFINFKWVSVENLLNEVHEHRKKLAKIVQQDFADGIIKPA